MFGTLGGQEILFILVIALIVFGPRKLPEIGKSIGRMMAEFRKASNDFRRTLEEEVESEKLRPAPPPASVDTVLSLTATAEPPPSAESVAAGEPAAVVGTDATPTVAPASEPTVSREPAEPTVPDQR